MRLLPCNALKIAENTEKKFKKTKTAPDMSAVLKMFI